MTNYDPRVDQLMGNPVFQALMAGGFAIPLNPNGARTDNPAGPVLNAYRSGSTIVVQIYEPGAGAWRSQTWT